jgi:hypothetical protein
MLLRSIMSLEEEYAMLKTLAGLSMLALAAPALAGPSDIVYQFEVQTSSEENEITCLETPSCPITPDKVPYLLGLLKLTHAALTQHVAQVTTETNPPVDDGRVVSFDFTALGCDPAKQPSCPNEFQFPPVSGLAVRYTFDLHIHGGQLGGNIDIVAAECCALSMQGEDGHWSGTWSEREFEHAFTAIVTRQNERIAGR